MSVAATGIEAPGVFVGTLLLVRVQVQVLTGRHAEARVDFREARRHLRSSSAQWGLDLAAVEAELARSGGELDAARDILERALAPEQAGEGQRYRWPVLSLAMRIEAERALAARDQDGRASVDDRRASRLRAEAEGMATRTPSDHGHLALVRAEHARLRQADEVSAWLDAIEGCRAMNEPWPLGYALLRHADALSAAGDSVVAAASAREARDLAHGMGAAPLLQDTEALIRRARLRTEEIVTTVASAPEPAKSDELERLGLTPREAEVLRLVAEGHSNSKIAEQLFISPKTASVHVSNILSKLSVSTRVQAAAVAHRQGLVRAAADA
jgi:DNA-binding CsgD family transcriptional regulator